MPKPKVLNILNFNTNINNVPKKTKGQNNLDAFFIFVDLEVRSMIFVI